MRLNESITDTAHAAPAPDDVFAAAMRRLRRRAGATLGSAAIAGAALVQLPAMAGCAVDDTGLAEADQNSWSQFEGQRNTDMVSFLGDAWTVCKQPNTRFGCGSIDVFIKVRVRPVQGADLAWKRVGVVYRQPMDQNERTAVGYYFTTYGNGDEEWHVPVTVYSTQATLIFDAWYQDGAGETWVDDNQGEYHVVNTSNAFSILRVEPWLNTIAVTDAGVQGKVSLQVADLDYDKEIALIGTTDGWETIVELGMGSAGQANAWYWTEDFPWSGFERWQIDVDLPGDVERFEYAVVYRHGIVNNARTYEFWDNNWAQNYVVEHVVEQ